MKRFVAGVLLLLSAAAVASAQTGGLSNNGTGSEFNHNGVWWSGEGWAVATLIFAVLVIGAMWWYRRRSLESRRSAKGDAYRGETRFTRSERDDVTRR